jgi:predicted GIY-YIG superfamily endonuclease
MPYRNINDYPLSSEKCTVYLLHFTVPFGHARHYIGMTKRDDIEARVQEHRTGQGARLCQLAVAGGAELILARVWEDKPRYFELRLKNRGGARKLCPICKGEIR